MHGDPHHTSSRLPFVHTDTATSLEPYLPPGDARCRPRVRSALVVIVPSGRDQHSCIGPMRCCFERGDDKGTSTWRISEARGSCRLPFVRMKMADEEGTKGSLKRHDATAFILFRTQQWLRQAKQSDMMAGRIRRKAYRYPLAARSCHLSEKFILLAVLPQSPRINTHSRCSLKSFL